MIISWALTSSGATAFKRGCMSEIIPKMVCKCCMRCIWGTTNFHYITVRKQPHPVHIHSETVKAGIIGFSYKLRLKNSSHACHVIIQIPAHLTELQVASWWVKAAIGSPFLILMDSLGPERTNKCCLCFCGLKLKLSRLSAPCAL